MAKVSAWTPKLTFQSYCLYESQASFLVMFSNLTTLQLWFPFPSLHGPPTHLSQFHQCQVFSDSHRERRLFLPAHNLPSMHPRPSQKHSQQSWGRLQDIMGIPDSLMTLQCRLGCKEETDGEEKRQAQKERKTLGLCWRSVANTLCSQYRGPGSILAQGTRFHMAQLTALCPN